MINSEHQDIYLHPLESYTKDKYNTLDEKNELLDLIINDIKEWKDACSQLDREDNYLGSFCITKCPTCYQWYLKMCEMYSDENNGESMKWSYFFSEYEKFNYTCGLESCSLASLDEKLMKEYHEKQHNRKNMLKLVQELQIGYRVAFEQQKNLSKQLNDNIQLYKEKNAILIFKKKSLQYIINSIQISIIIVSSVITLFEAIQGTVLKNILANATDIETFPFIIFPIVCSSYIGLILAIGRFFKFDTKNEQIIKLIEKYSFIINKLRQKRSKYMDFDFKIHNIEEWNKLLSMLEKDSIDDIIMKANEECDLILTPKEYTHYKKKYTKTRMKDLLEHKNYDELTDIITHKTNNAIQKDITLQMIKKRNFCEYYFCLQCLCFDRDYLDYKSVLVNNRVQFYSEDSEKTNTFVFKKKEGRMKNLASNIINLKRDINKKYEREPSQNKCNNDDGNDDGNFNNLNIDKQLSKQEKQEKQEKQDKQDKLGKLTAFNKQEYRRKKSKSIRTSSSYDINNISKKYRREYVKRRGSFSKDQNTVDCNAWLHMQKNKNNEDVLKLIGSHDFSKIRDMSKNKVFKNLSNKSNDDSSSNTDNVEEADHVVLAIGDTNSDENKTQESKESKESNNTNE